MRTDQSRLPGTLSKPKTGTNFFREVQDDFFSGKRYVLARSRVKQLRDKKQAAERQLLSTLEHVGAKAVEFGIGKEVAGFQEAEALRASLTGAETALAGRSAARKQAEEGFAEETQRHSKAIALETEHRRLTQAASVARQAVSSVRQEISALESRIRVDGGGNPCPRASTVHHDFPP